ncbi:hypothetical protein EVAR_46552_1 [Eumeta japonica]|uniref:Uncharacterized protein n=1 Tax=Eumeta variegata TaxID=151549 RepID=A0A4C1XNJ3_EUMVA|nr:hypothetical protein EVAR_46552_1 [Eumeta japonica]
MIGRTPSTLYYHRRYYRRATMTHVRVRYLSPSRGIGLRVPLGRGSGQRTSSFHILTSDLGYLDVLLEQHHYLFILLTIITDSPRRGLFDSMRSPRERECPSARESPPDGGIRTVAPSYVAGARPEPHLSAGFCSWLGVVSRESATGDGVLLSNCRRHPTAPK